MTRSTSLGRRVLSSTVAELGKGMQIIEGRKALVRRGRGVRFRPKVDGQGLEPAAVKPPLLSPGTMTSQRRFKVAGRHDGICIGAYKAQTGNRKKS